jgi:cytochrome c biogenesis protein CcdA
VIGLLYLLVYSLGLPSHLFDVGLSLGALGALPRAGAWTGWIKRAGGFLLIAMAEYYLVKMGGVL